MQVYVDESGDPGMKRKVGSSTVFVVTAVIFATDAAAVDCRARIRHLHKRLEWSPRQEFKFNKCDHGVKQRFFDAVAPCDFGHVSVVLNKEKVTGAEFRNKDSFYGYTTRLLFGAAAAYLESAVVVMDHCGSRDFREQMSACIRTHAIDRRGTPLVRSVRSEKSHACELVQLADMVVGAVARSVQPVRPDAGRFRAMLAHRELVVQVWPR